MNPNIIFLIIALTIIGIVTLIKIYNKSKTEESSEENKSKESCKYKDCKIEHNLSYNNYYPVCRGKYICWNPSEGFYLSAHRYNAQGLETKEAAVEVVDKFIILGTGLKTEILDIC